MFALCRKIPGYFSKIPSYIPSFGFGGEDDVEYVEYDASDSQGWVTVPESSGWGLPSLPSIPSIPSLPSLPSIKTQVCKYLSKGVSKP